MQQLNKDTRDYQSSLADYCRTGAYQAIPGVKTAQHVSQYRRLVYNVVDDMLQSAYPLTKGLLKEEEWDELVQEFFSRHACQSPQVWYMPKELYEYIVQQEAHPLLTKYPFLHDL
ncbi:MAG TPA: DNA-binding domain-containing protein, partial [Chitinophaga sp.]